MKNSVKCEYLVIRISWEKKDSDIYNRYFPDFCGFLTDKITGDKVNLSIALNFF